MKKPRPYLPPLLLKVTETAQVLGMGRTRCHELISAAVIPSVKIGGMRRVPIHALRQWIESMLPDYDPGDFDEEVRRVVQASRQG